MVAAVKVSRKGATWPMVVRLKDADGFRAMMSSIKETATAAAGTTASLK